MPSALRFSATPFRIVAAIATALFACLLLLVPGHAHAQGGQAFSISPTLIELSADPGETKTATIKLTNLSDTELTMTAQSNDFGSKNETGEPNIIFDDSESTPHSLKNWVALPEDFTIASKETKTVDVPIDIPEDAEPGGHYAVIRFTGNAKAEDGSQVALSASIGSLVMLKVSGEIQQKVSVASFYSAHKNFSETSFFEYGPVAFVERLKNEGNIHVKPTGTIEIKNIFGKVVSTIRVNGDPGQDDNLPKSVLPQSIRRFDQSLEGKRLFGKYKATLALSYGDPQQKIEQSITFWVIPYKLIIAVILAIVLLVLVIRFGIRRYNKHIIKKAQAMQQPAPPANTNQSDKVEPSAAPKPDDSDQQDSDQL